MLAFTIPASATIITVSNTTNTAAMQVEIVDAVAIANPFDTILVSPSGQSYDGFQLSKNVHIIATGTGTHIDYLNIGTAVTGGSIQGLIINGNLNADINSSGLLVKNCQLANVYLFYMNNYLFINNQFNGYVEDIGQSGGCIFSNNVFIAPSAIYSPFQSPNSSNSSTFTNNLFIMAPALNLFSNHDYYNMTFQNNIVMGIMNIDNCFTSSFNNNIAASWTDPTVTINGNVGTGNFIGESPVFVDYDGSFQTSDDNMQLVDGTPGDNGGTDGSDIGPFGGSEPFTFTSQYGTYIPGLPYVTYMQLDQLIVPVNSSVQMQATGTIITE